MRIPLLIGLLALGTFANVLRPDTDQASFPNHLEERTAQLVKRSRPKCGPKLASTDTTSAAKSAEVGFIRFERNATAIEKRMELPDDSIGSFYGRQLPRLSQAIVPHETADYAEDMSTAVMKTFSSLGRRKEYSTGTMHLSGCTTMYIISRKGVYATHWWENVSFAPDDEWRDPETQTDEEIFQNTVIDMLKSGGKFHPKLEKRLIEDDFIKAYLIHPSKTSEEAPGDVGYPDQWEMIRTTVGELVPTLKDRSRWTDIPYEGLNNNSPLLDEPDGTRGKNLFKYDPLHDLGGGLKGRLAMLWAEDKLAAYHEDTW